MSQAARSWCRRIWGLAVGAVLTTVSLQAELHGAIVFTTNPGTFSDLSKITFESLDGVGSNLFNPNAPLNNANDQQFVAGTLGGLTLTVNNGVVPANPALFSASGLTNVVNSGVDVGSFASRVAGARGEVGFAANTLDLLFNVPAGRVAFDAYSAYGAIGSTGNLVVNVFNSANTLLGTTTITARNNSPTFIGILSDSLVNQNEIARVSLVSGNPSALGEAVDNVQFGAAIPEPSSLVLLGLCASGFAGYRFRRWKAGAASTE